MHALLLVRAGRINLPRSHVDCWVRLHFQFADVLDRIGVLPEIRTHALERSCRRRVITPSGRRQYKRLTTLATKAQDEIFAALSPAARNRLTTLLGRLLAQHQ